MRPIFGGIYLLFTAICVIIVYIKIYFGLIAEFLKLNGIFLAENLKKERKKPVFFDLRPFKKSLRAPHLIYKKRNENDG